MTRATTCPDCGATFRVQAEQLRQRDGLVRCGVCQRVFSALDGPQPTDDDVPAVAPLLRRRDVAVPGSARRDRTGQDGPDPAAQPPGASGARRAAPTPGQSDRSDRPDRRSRSDRSDRPNRLDRAGRSAPPAPPDPFARPRARGRTFAAGVALIAALSLAAVLQAALAARDVLAAWAPALRPALAALAGSVGLRVELPRRLSQLTIEGFDLHAGTERSQLVMTAVLRNAGAMPAQWPAMELTLTDEAGRVAVRRALLPAEYLRGTPRRPDAGIAAQSELPVRLVLEAPASRSASYTVSLFYP